MAKVTDVKFDNHVHRDSRDMNPWKIFEKGAWPGSCDPINFWALNANCSNTVKDTDFKFDKHVYRESPNVTSWKIFEKGAWSGLRVVDPLNFWALNGNCSNTVKDTDFKFDKHVHRESPDVTLCLLYTSPSPRDGLLSRMPSSA